MEHTRLLRLAPSRALKEKRLASLRGERDESDPLLREAVEDAQVAGSLALSGVASSVMDVRAARRGEPVSPAVHGLLAALGAIEPTAPFSLRAVRLWHAAAVPGGGAFRTTERERPGGPPPAPAAFVASRLEILEQWLQVESSRELGAGTGGRARPRAPGRDPALRGRQRPRRAPGGLAPDATGGRAPADPRRGGRPRLRQALQAAFQLHTEPLAALLEEASERSLDVMIQALERRVTDTK